MLITTRHFARHRCRLSLSLSLFLSLSLSLSPSLLSACVWSARRFPCDAADFSKLIQTRVIYYTRKQCVCVCVCTDCDHSGRYEAQLDDGTACWRAPRHNIYTLLPCRYCNVDLITLWLKSPILLPHNMSSLFFNSFKFDTIAELSKTAGSTAI